MFLIMDVEKILFSYYKIRDEFSDGRGFDLAVGDIIRIANAKEGSVKYEEQKVDAGKFRDFGIRVFYNSKEAAPGWLEIIKSIVKKGEAITSCKSITPSFIMFAGYKKRIFAVTGGLGAFAIQGYVSQSFGIDILSRLIQADSQVIKSFQNRGVTGVLLAQSKQFRKDRRLMDENSFGQIYKELKADLDKRILIDIFGFKPSELKRKVLGCLAKATFQISKRLDIKGFLAVAKKLNALLDLPPNFSINNMDLISGKKAGPLIRKLQQGFMEFIYEGYKNGEELDIDFCHRDVDKYRTAAYYSLPQTALAAEEQAFEFNELLRKLEAAGKLDVTDVTGFKRSLQRIEIQTQDEGGTMLTSGSIYEHLNGELMFEGQMYFLIDGDWYRIKPSFVVELDIELKQLLDRYWDDKLITEPFDTRLGEGAFNMSFVGRPGFLVLDKIVPENIEACDLLNHDNGLDLIHVKQGFDGRVRDLASQILISARRIEQDLKTDYGYISKLQAALEACKTSPSTDRQKLGHQTIPALKKLFADTRQKNICFCFAFAHSAGKKRTLKDNISSYRSNIAKYSLLLLIREVIAMGFDFKVIQLEAATGARKAAKKKAFAPGVDGV
jgi:uncharacterized protein (TIGR04141 family)